MTEDEKIIEERKSAGLIDKGAVDAWFQRSEKTLLWLDRIIFPLFCRHITPEMSVLDVGCGTGRISVRLAEYGCKVTGVDISINMMEHLKNAIKEKGLDIELFEANAKNLPFDSESFDAVVSMWFLEHFPTWKDFLAEQVRVTKKGGIIAFEFSFKEHEYMAHSLVGGRISQYYRSDDVAKAAQGASYYATTTMPELNDFCVEIGVSVEAVMPHSLLDHNAFFMDATTIDVCRKAKKEIIPNLIDDPNILDYASFFENEMVSNMPFWATRRCIVVLKKT